MSLWIKEIINRLSWCCTSSIGNEQLISEKWPFMLNHIRCIHSWEDYKIFHKCEHGQLDQEQKWLKTDSLFSFKECHRKSDFCRHKLS